MATTFKPIVIPSERKQDGTYNVKIRVTHNRKNKRISTHLFAGSGDLVRATLQIKNQTIIYQCNGIIKEYRDKVDKLGMGAAELTVDEIVKFITAKDERVEIKVVEKTDEELYGFKLDFIEFGRKVADSKSKSTSHNYHTALNCLERFVRHERNNSGLKPENSKPDDKVELDISEVTAKFLERFEAYIASEPVHCYSRKTGLKIVEKNKKGRAISSYMENMRHIHNRAKWEYNDEDMGIIRIVQSPFGKYKVKKAPAPNPKPLSISAIQNIINLPDAIRKFGPPKTINRRDLGRDCFLISFGLAGINAADLYDCKFTDFDRKEMVLTYGRKKTRTRRVDGAIMKIRIEPYILPLIEKYLSNDKKKLFNFAEHYSSIDCFNNALKAGLEQVSEAISEKTFTYYSARYSWATIGRSDEVGIDKYTIHEGLNHVDDNMKVTDGYIMKDYRPIWNANLKILEQFDWSEILKREESNKIALS